MSGGVRIKHTFRLRPDLSAQLDRYAARTRASQSQIVEQALASFFSPDASERLEAAITRRLDRLSRQNERLEEHVEIANEAIALFVRFWLSSTPPLPDSARPAAQAAGRDRYRGFVESLGRRMETGRTLSRELAEDREMRAEDTPGAAPGED